MLQQAFRQARAAAPSILFLDEIDSLFGNRADVDQEAQDTQLLSTLLTEMDGLQLATGAPLDCSRVALPHVERRTPCSDRSTVSCI